MTPDEIIKMARQAGFVAYGEDAGEYRIPTPAFYGRLEHFAALVAEAERKACAKLAESLPMQQEIDVRDQCAAAIHARGEK
jgi:hypothetical protein